VVPRGFCQSQRCCESAQLTHLKARGEEAGRSLLSGEADQDDPRQQQFTTCRESVKGPRMRRLAVAQIFTVVVAMLRVRGES
jgi:hypothetical protein